MILHTDGDDEYESTLRQLIIINLMRAPRLPIVEDTPWVRTRWPKPEYL